MESRAAEEAEREEEEETVEEEGTGQLTADHHGIAEQLTFHLVKKLTEGFAQIVH